MTSKNDMRTRRNAPLRTPSDILPESVKEVSGALNKLLADVFALYLKTKTFHWHMSGPHFRDYHLLLDEQGDQIFAMTDDIAERARKIGGLTMRSIGEISRLQRIADNDAEYVTAEDMLSELCEDNKALVLSMRSKGRRRHYQLARKLDRWDSASCVVPLRNHALSLRQQFLACISRGGKRGYVFDPTIDTGWDGLRTSCGSEGRFEFSAGGNSR